MKPHIVSNEGKCSTCEGVVKDNEILECYKCKSYFHAICDNDTPFANKSFVQTFNTNRAKKENFFFMCDSCLTLDEQETASDLKAQILNLNATYSMVRSIIYSNKLFLRHFASSLRKYFALA